MKKFIAYIILLSMLMFAVACENVVYQESSASDDESKSIFEELEDLLPPPQTDENGEVFSVTGSGIRASIRKYYMKNFLTEDPAVMRGTLDLSKLIPGNSYHCIVKVQLASGDIITVRDFDFVATDADISVPEGSDTIDPEEPEEEEIPDEPGVTPDDIL